ncbi:membrane protein [Gordonia phage Archimedes]|uniref:Membrane protein n=1 Tax=Gordonia phage Archimedes TaxID=2759389 RepID=A0A7L7SH13_9CAUD|nr:membrane protein [Gordonia phage Archimedes]QOC55722.1 membrane protein [Gordonia phage Archimedes]
MNYLIVALVSFSIGFITELGYLYIRGRRILVPFISATSRNFTIAAVALSLVALMTIVNVQQSADKSEECDRQFREALKYNTDLTAQQRTLDEHEDALDAQARRNINRVIREVSESTSRPDSLRALVGYNTQAAILDREYAKVDAERVRLNNSRKTYPEPTCGR